MTDLRSTPTIALQAERIGEDGKGWAHLLPAGRFTGIDGRGPYSADDLDAIIAESRRLSGQRQMVLDYNHGTDLAAKHGKEAPAAGWIVGLQARADGIWGLVEWTEKARQHIAAREYRYVSPVICHSATGAIGAILRASLTNTPNYDQLTALASAEERTMDKLTHAAIIDLLGLPANADDAAIIAAIKALVEKSATHSERPDPAKFVPIGDFQRVLAEANKLRQGVSRHAAEEQVDGDIRKGVILPWMKDWAVSLCMANAPAYESFLSGVGPGFSHLLKQHVPGVPPSLQSEGAGLSDTEKQVARNLGLTHEEYIAARGRD